MTQQVLALKWRPRTFSEVIGQPHVVQALSNGLDNNRLHHAFLFTGTRGVGKTTLARIFAKSLNCEKGVSSTPCGVCSICKEVDEGRFVDLIEIDAASRTRVEDTREILDNVQYAPTRGRYKIYLIDEVHMLSNSSFNALLKTLEEPPAHVKFLLATTDPQKLPVTVLSRCLRFQLKRIQDQEIAGQLSHILTAENIPFEENALKLIAKAGDGSMRDALSLLDQAIAYGGQKVEYQRTHEMLGLIDTHYLINVLEALATKNTDNIITVLGQLKANGIDYHRFLEDLIDAFHLLTMMQLSDTLKENESIEMQQLSQRLSAEDLQLFYQIALTGRKDLQNHPNSSVGFEMTLLRMVLFSPTAPILPEDTEKKSKVSTESVVASVERQVSSDPGDVAIVTIENKTHALSVPESHAVAEEISAPKKEILPPVDLPWEPMVDSSKAKVLDSPLELSISAQNGESASTVMAAASDSVQSELTQENAHDPGRFNADENFTEDQNVERENTHNFDLGSHEEIIQNTVQNDIHASTLQNHVPEVDTQNFVQKNGIDHIKNQDQSSELVIESAGDIAPVENDLVVTAATLTNNEVWLQLVSQLKLESVLSGIAHSLVFKQFDGKHLSLERPLSVKDFRVDETETRLAMAISDYLEQSITCQIEYVETLHGENLHERTERLDEEQYQKMLADFKSDQVVQYLTNEWNAQLLEKTLKAKH
ncbi:DNA polymerase III subunit gamma/tau [Ignatzschineria larvae DSM 13226]|uniref:DNA polymerase III subunit gamma/tau n=1 Tax=Ignatzschineria larvae DSM 13226 TaxID=1111732 RepID=A0ABZ3BX80_9GAMM|nr:DNA polymerase III subunit gamma/tau [Ignatzschineria larvae]